MGEVRDAPGIGRGLDSELLGRLTNEGETEGEVRLWTKQTFQCSHVVHIKLGASLHNEDIFIVLKSPWEVTEGP